MSLQDWTALPNLHPALVHFPIVLVALGLLGDLLLVTRVRSAALDRHLALLWLGAAASAGATYLAGDEAAESLTLPSTADATLGLHEDWALATLIGIAFVGVLRIAVAWWDRHESFPGPHAARVVALVGAFVVQGLVLRTADLGGALVYRHGVAVAPIAAAAGSTPRAAGSEPLVSEQPSTARAESSESRTGAQPARRSEDLQRLSDGSLRWTPWPGDTSVLGRVLESQGDGRVEVLPASGGARGLALRVDGKNRLLLPGTFEDERVEVRWDTTAFSGRVGILARLGPDGRAGLLDVRPGGAVALAVLDGDGGVNSLGGGESSLPTGPWSVAFSLVGRHWRGLVEGRAVVHGHAPLVRPGRVGLVLDGRGVVRIEWVRVQGVEDRS